MFRWKWKAATTSVHVPCIDVAVAPATYTCPIVPRRGLRRGILELRNANMIMSQGSGIAHRGAGVGPGAGVIRARLSVNGRSGCRAVLGWPLTRHLGCVAHSIFRRRQLLIIIGFDGGVTGDMSTGTP